MSSTLGIGVVLFRGKVVAAFLWLQVWDMFALILTVIDRD